MTNARQVACGAHAACALVGTAVTCWGANDYGQLGRGGLADGTESPMNPPANVLGLGAASFVAIGNYHACALVAGNDMWFWGQGTNGQLAESSRTNRGLAVRVP